MQKQIIKMVNRRVEAKKFVLKSEGQDCQRNICGVDRTRKNTADVRWFDGCDPFIQKYVVIIIPIKEFST